MSEDLGTIRAACRADLPSRIRAALDDYLRFVADDPPADAKGFAAWQAAAKAGLGHVEALVKLARWAEGEIQAEDDGDDGLGRLLAQARSALDELDEDGA
ncbi:hypothetical protein [Magnetospirillum sulfuroxidans]|uniref:Uncharacterized protein n=1 Tax=Magnetospirillum sulfuroxidans TaxID=611300 RepID=A0ABS5I9W2_9PROT|nr:hypothetical protein [Magnetospirillum sulfuroxidans]MBR9971222.1 hypothetical protein [Magnetospirillum sulfuroxidans]